MLFHLYFTLKLSIYILNFSVDFFPPAIPVQNTQTRTASPPPSNHTHTCTFYYHSIPIPVPHQLKWWPADLAVSGLIPASIPACGENLSKRGRGPIGNCHSLSLSHRPDMTEILFKGRKIASHLFIPPYLTASTTTQT